MSDLAQSWVVSIICLVVHSLQRHLVSLAGTIQLLIVVEESWVQGVSVDQTHQVFFVVFSAPKHTHKYALKHYTFLYITVNSVEVRNSLAESSLSRLSLATTWRIFLLTSLIFLLHYSTGLRYVHTQMFQTQYYSDTNKRL